MRLINYEYKNVKLAGSCVDNNKIMNELGAKGWKLVARTDDEATFMCEHVPESVEVGTPDTARENIWR